MDFAVWTALIGAIAALVTAILPPLIAVIRERRRRRVKVTRICDVTEPLLWEALTLYERRVPGPERDELENIVRWLLEVQDESRRGVCKLDDYFIVARLGRHVAGFAYFHVYPRMSLGFFSYLVVSNTLPEATRYKVSMKLLQEAQRLVKRSGLCRALLLEVEEPDTLQGRDAAAAAARIRHFTALARAVGCSLKSVGVEYFQPKLSLNAQAKEVRMRLMYAPVGFATEPRVDREAQLDRGEIENIFDFLATCIYGDHFEHDPTLDRAYRDYLTDWKTRLLRAAPGAVRLF